MKRIMKLSLFAGFGLVISSGLAFGQVFTQAPGAVVGTTTQGTGQKLYGGLGLDSANNPEFNIYRKYNEVTSGNDLSSAANAPGNPGEVIWSDVNQRQGVGGRRKERTGGTWYVHWSTRQLPK